VPGGIVRFKETLETRVRKVAKTELGVAVSFDATPMALNQIINPKHEIRGHFISFLYKCTLPSAFIPENKGISPDDAGYLMWHNNCPDDLLSWHEMYRKYI